MFGFLKKGGGGGRLPTDRIRQLSTQGMTEPQIISELRGEGYRSGEVDRGFREVLKSAATSEAERRFGTSFGRPGPSPETQLPPLPTLPGMEQGRGRIFEEPTGLSPKGKEATLPGLPSMPSTPSAFGGGEQLSPEDELDELVDLDAEDEEEVETPTGRSPRGVRPSMGMVEGRVNRLEQDMEELLERMERMEGRLHNVEDRAPTKDSEEREMRMVKQAAEDQQKAMGEVSLRMEAVERVMKDSLTPMMQTMRSLSDTLKTMKGGQQY